VVELERIAYENFVEHVRPRLYDGVVEHINGLRRGGTQIVLLSSSPGLVIEPLSLYLGCSATLTTPVVIERNRLIDIGAGPACYGEGKLYWAQRWADEQGIAMSEAAGYADNWSDRALLEHVGHAVVVHPKGRLLRLARSRGWEVVRPWQPGQPPSRRRGLLKRRR
jgi:phosphoserine phosphatase